MSVEKHSLSCKVIVPRSWFTFRLHVEVYRDTIVQVLLVERMASCGKSAVEAASCSGRSEEESQQEPATSAPTSASILDRLRAPKPSHLA